MACSQLPQQRIHFIKTQHLPRLDRGALADDPHQPRLQLLLHQIAVLLQAVQHIPESGVGIALVQHRGHGPDEPGAAAKVLDLKPHPRQQALVPRQHARQIRAHLHGQGHKQALTDVGIPLFPGPRHPLFVQNALMGGVLVHQHHALFRLGHDVHRSHLANDVEGRQLRQLHGGPSRRSRHRHLPVGAQIHVDRGQPQFQFGLIAAGGAGIPIRRHRRQAVAHDGGVRYALPFPEGLLDHLPQAAVHLPRPHHAHLEFLRVHVDVQFRRLQVQEHHGHGKPAPGQTAVVGLHHRMGQGSILDPPSVDIEVDLPAVGIVEGWRRHKALYPQLRRSGGHGQHAAGEWTVVQVVENLPDIPAAVGAEKRTALVDVGEANVRMGQGVPLHHAGDLARLRRLGLHKPLPDGRVDEQPFHPHGRALGAPHCGLMDQVTALHPDPAAGGGPAPARGHGHMADGGDAVQSLAPKAQRMNPVQLLDPAQFARRMTVERQRHALRLDPFAVILHLDGIQTTALQLHRNPGRTGIQAVFHQFLHHIDRALNHLAGRNLGHDVRSENLDGHGCAETGRTGKTTGHGPRRRRGNAPCHPMAGSGQRHVDMAHPGPITCHNHHIISFRPTLGP